MQKYCEECNEWVEVENGRCVICNTPILKNKDKTSKFDSWEEESIDDWGASESDLD